MTNKKPDITNKEGVPGITETIPAATAEEMGAFEETAMGEADGLDADEELSYTFKELKEALDNPKPMTAEEIKNTFIEDDRPIDISKLKI